MFFMSYILVLINCLSYSNTYVLKRVHHNEDGRIKTDDNYEILQENQTYTRNPNLKVNIFDQKLSDEMLSLEQSIYERDQSAKFHSIKNNIGTPTLDINQKWPAVSLLSNTPKPHFEEHDYNIDEILDFRNLFSEQDENTPLSTNVPADLKSSIAEEKHKQLQEKLINLDDVAEQRNQSKDKIFDLRSLAHHTPYNNNIPVQNVDPVSCGCTRGKGKTNWTPESDKFDDPIAHTTSKKCGACGASSISISYTLMPYYVPYNPPIYYPPYVITEGAVTEGTDDDSDGDETDDESDYESYEEIKKSKNKKKKKCPKKPKPPKDEVIIDITYDDKPAEPEIKWDTMFFEGHPNKLVNNLVDDLRTLYQDSVIKKCYCSSCSNLNFALLSYFVLLIFMILL